LAKTFASVLIDTYNHERFIEQALVSVLEQDFPASEREILVVDDGSTDRTPEIVKKFSPQVQLLQKTNGGQASAFNAGIPACKGEIVAFLDGDDWWAPRKLRVVVGEFKAHPEVATVGHGIFEADETGRQTTVNTPDRIYVSNLRNMEEGKLFMALRAFLGTSRLAVRSEVLRKILPLPDALTIEADEFVATMATALAGARVIDQPLTNYRLHSGNRFQFAEWSDAKARRKCDALRALESQLLLRLGEAGVPREVTDLLVKATRVDADRLRLSLGEGWPWQTLRTEREVYHLAYQRRDLSYRIFHGLVLGIASLLPPSWFYSLRSWYAAKGLARVRKQFCGGTPTDTLTQRRMMT
jgi:glycosyltransferase involved in cell wall biosynthesis